MGRPPIDLTGKKFGKLTAIDIACHGGSHKSVKWRCSCECGREKIVDSQLLKKGSITDCGCRINDRLVGEKFGRLTVISNTGKRKGGKVIWLCRCDCGNLTEVMTCNLNMNKKNSTQSCGCLRLEKHTKHNLSHTNLYKILVSIKGRCKNPKNQNYFRYGGRGINLCEQWDGEDGYETFYKWALENGYKEGLSIDRIDNNKGYFPENCRWVSQKTQMNNQSRNHYVTVDGETHSLKEWSEINNICIGTIEDRIKRGWSDVDAVSTPVKRKNRRTS